ncbi:MAG: hypothetical protein HYV27_19210 [Candidatus Hydrogenedentes bacterium]|nr:hypothetical protein [Candidatus Hydrogenedentota bacterium]
MLHEKIRGSKGRISVTSPFASDNDVGWPPFYEAEVGRIKSSILGVPYVSWEINEDVQSNSIENVLRNYFLDKSLYKLLLSAFKSEQSQTYLRHLQVRDKTFSSIPTVSATESSSMTPSELAIQLLSYEENVNSSTLRELIILAEEMDFDANTSRKLAPFLLGFARRFRDSVETENQVAVWSAIRTGASMLRPEEADQLCSLLEPGHPIETSLVTVKMLGRIFEANPPLELDMFPNLSDVVYEMARQLLNKYAIAVSQSAAMSQLAVFALSGMGSLSLVSAIDQVIELNAPWFAVGVQRKLTRLQGEWLSRSVNPDSPPFRQISYAIQRLQGNTQISAKKLNALP